MKTKAVIKISLFLITFFAAITAIIHLDKKIFAVEAIDVAWTPQAKEYCFDQKLLCEYLQGDLDTKLTTEINKKIWQVDIADLRQRLMQNNWFKMVAIARQYPSKISLTIDIEAPVALLAIGNEVLAVADEGQLLAPVKTNFLPALPILKGENFFHNRALRKLATNFLRDISGNSELSSKTIAEMTYSKDENFNLLILPSKSIVKMGAEQAGLKAERVAQVIEYLNSNQMNGRVIDARFSKKVLVRLRKGS